MDVVLDRLARRLAGRREQRRRYRRRSRDRRRPRRSPSGRDRGRPGPSWRPGCAGGGPRRARRPRPAARTRSTAVGRLPTSRCRRPRSRGSRPRAGPRPSPALARSRRRVARARAASTASSSRLPSPCRAADSAVERRLHVAVIALGAQALQLFDLRGAHGGVVDLQHARSSLRPSAVAVDADDRLLAGIDPRLRARGGLLDAQLRHAGLDGPRHAAERLDLRDVRPGARARSAVSRST